MTKSTKSTSKQGPASSDSSKLTQESRPAWQSSLSSVPSEPGVYWFLNDRGDVLYVGKAKNLKNRVRSYTQTKQLSNRIHRMTHQAVELKFEVLESELVALLVEAELIRTHQPEFNVLLKDDKSELYIHITNDTFPMVETMRKKEMIRFQPDGTVLGPFSSAYKVREVLKIVRPIFRWCNKRGSGDESPKPCFYYHIDQCSGACVGEIPTDAYQHAISHLVAFLKGKKKTVTQELKEELKAAADSQAYETAAELRDMLALIEDVTSTKKRLKPEYKLPLIQQNQIKEGLMQLRGLLSQYAGTPNNFELTRIEGYDVSNIQGTHPAVAMVTFIDGQPDSSEYRLFNIRTLNTPNDYGMMQEAIVRRQNNPQWGRPQLLVIDGGKGQLRAALSQWTWSNPVISIAKNPDRLIIPIINERETNLNDRITGYHVLQLDTDHPALKLVQRIRDEAHRFSKKQHTRLRTKAMLSDS